MQIRNINNRFVCSREWLSVCAWKGKIFDVPGEDYQWRRKFTCRLHGLFYPTVSCAVLRTEPCIFILHVRISFTFTLPFPCRQQIMHKFVRNLAQTVILDNKIGAITAIHVMNADIKPFCYVLHTMPKKLKRKEFP